LIQTELAESIIGEHFGDIVKVVTRSMMRVKSSTIAEIIRNVRNQLEGSERKFGSFRRLEINQNLVKKALLILCQHNCIEVMMPTTEEVLRTKPHVRLRYRLKFEACLQMLRSPRFILLAKVMHGDIASMIIEQIFLHGRLKKDDIITHTIRSLAANGFEDEINESLKKKVGQMFNIMVKERFVVKVPPFDLSRPEEPPSRTEGLKKSLDFSIQKEETDKIPIEKKSSKILKKRNRYDFNESDEETIPIEMQMMLDNQKIIAGEKLAKKNSAVKADIGRYELEETEEQDTPKEVRGRVSTRGRKAPKKRIKESTKKMSSKTESKSSLASDKHIAVKAENEIENEKLSEAQKSVVWKVGVDQFHRVCRHLICMKLVKEHIPNKLAHDIMHELMKLAAPMERTANDPQSVSILFSELMRVLRTPTSSSLRLYKIALGSKPCLPSPQTVRAFLQHFASPKLGWIIEISDYGEGPGYVMNYLNMIKYIRERDVHSCITEIYDIETARICRVLNEKHYMEENAISDIALLPVRETREKLYRLMRDRLVLMQEVPRTSSHEPKSTTYLWTTNPQFLISTMKNRTENALLKVRIRYQHTYSSNKHLLEHEEKFKTMESDLRSKMANNLNRLRMAQLKLDETLMMYSCF